MPSCFTVDKFLVEIPHAHLEFGIDFIVPLLEPRQQISDTNKHQDQSLFRGPCILELCVIGGERLSLLQVVPASLGQYQSRIAFALASRIYNETFFRYIKLATKSPVS